MKRNRILLLIASIILMAFIWIYIIRSKGRDIFAGYELYILILISIIGVIAFIRVIKRDKEEKEGLPAEDELSNIIKYKSGHYAYMASMYMWMIIFVLKDQFPNNETMIGGGILLSALISFIARIVVKNELNEK